MCLWYTLNAVTYFLLIWAYAKALAREEAYAQAEAGNFVPSKVSASNSRGDVTDVTTNIKVRRTDGIKGSQFAPPEKKEEAKVQSGRRFLLGL